MSAMYQQKVPQYSTLLKLVANVNLAVLKNNPQLHKKIVNANKLAQLNVKRHKAIRVKTAQKLATLQQMFAIIKMYPVSYYNLSQAKVPVHSTAFQPINNASLARNPFRVFTSLLRLKLIKNKILRQKAAKILRQRNIFTPRCQQLLKKYKQQSSFNKTQAQKFVQKALKTFRWHQSATVNKKTYRALHNKHQLIANVVCFPKCHINHLTPRTLNINQVQSIMPKCKIKPKILIKKPPRRKVPILLRQTSFKALKKTVLFAGQKQGTHTARFSKIKQRSVALTPKKQQLYNNLLRNAKTKQNNLTHQMHLQKTFRTFPNSKFLMRQQKLA